VLSNPLWHDPRSHGRPPVVKLETNSNWPTTP
jgi:hypothetical protein